MVPSGVLVALVVAMSLGVMSDDVPQPFKVVWNYPDAPCQALHIDFELEKFHIDYNEHHKFVEDTIGIFYSDLAGKWPYIDFKNGGEYKNGGLPKDVDMEAHLAAFKEAIAAGIKPDAHGFGVIDMENWRPVFFTNYGRYTPYKAIFTKWLEETYPDMPNQQRRRMGNDLWKNDSLDLMIASLNAAKEIAPQEHWGYYGYPQFVTKKQNKQLTRLWKEITAYYPSIYIKNFDDPDAKREKIMETLAESFRVRAEYGNPEDPIMPYTVAQYRNLGLFDQSWLAMEIRMPIEMGVDGLILWASSEEFWPPKEKCASEHEFVLNTLGPLVQSELERMTKCSQQMCTARGRCVKKEYADKYPYTKTRGTGGKALGFATPSGTEPMPMVDVDEEFRDDFVCQCYVGSAGDRCTDEY